MRKYFKYSVLLIMASIFFIGLAKAQVYKTNNGEITFVSKTDFKEFKAVNNTFLRRLLFLATFNLEFPSTHLFLNRH